MCFKVDLTIRFETEWKTTVLRKAYHLLFGYDYLTEPKVPLHKY